MIFFLSCQFAINISKMFCPFFCLIYITVFCILSADMILFQRNVKSDDGGVFPKHFKE